MQVHVVRPSDLGAAERAAWRVRQHHDELASPFLAPEFALAVDGARDDARVAVIEGIDAGLAFFAFSVDGDGVGAPVGASICDAQALLASDTTAFDPRGVVRASGLASWRFDHLLSSQHTFAPYHHSLHASPIADLSQGHDAYLQAVRASSKDVLTQTARRRRKLGREVGDVVFEWDTADPSVLDTLLSWKSAQYRETGTWDRFDQPWIVDVVRALASTTSQSLTGVTATLRAGEQLVAGHFGLLGRDRLAWWFPVYDPQYRSYSPGLILLLDLIAASAARGLRMVDLGRGEHHYKLRVATASYEVAEGVVPADRA